MSINDFRDFVKNVLNSSLHVLIPECTERQKHYQYNCNQLGRSRTRVFINESYLRDKRNNLLVKKVSNLMIINFIGLPLDLWNPTPSVKTWLRKNHSADDNRAKK